VEGRYYGLIDRKFREEAKESSETAVRVVQYRYANLLGFSYLKSEFQVNNI
jgi:hypothetical protein